MDDLYYSKLEKPLQAIKIDTEGEDYNVLLGSEKLIRDFRPKIIIEVREENKFEIQSFFSKYNYKIFNISDLINDIDLRKIEINNIINVFAK